MRIAAVSDLHGQFPVIPPCDLLIVAGDVCPDAFERRFSWDAPELQKAWFDREFRPWLAAAPATHKVLTWGNHDICGERCNFDADDPGIADSRTLQIVNTRTTSIPNGAGSLTLFCSPWCNPCGMWSFWRRRPELAKIYDTIPAGIDVLVSHQPPHGYCDGANEWGTTRVTPAGSRELLQAIDRVKPKVVICGHIHEAHGSAERGGTRIFNVSVVDDQYRLVNQVTIIDL
jgi:Icc-related predicted phosphoesterase